jgi:hypothetical protein
MPLPFPPVPLFSDVEATGAEFLDSFSAFLRGFCGAVAGQFRWEAVVAGIGGVVRGTVVGLGLGLGVGLDLRRGKAVVAVEMALQLQRGIFGGAVWLRHRITSIRFGHVWDWSRRIRVRRLQKPEALEADLAEASRADGVLHCSRLFSLDMPFLSLVGVID